MVLSRCHRRDAKRRALLREESSLNFPGDGIFSTPSCPGSIVCAGAFHFRVREGNGWFHPAMDTRKAKPDISGAGRSPALFIPSRWEGGNTINALVAGVGFEPTTF